MITYFSKGGIINPTIPSSQGAIIQNHPTFQPSFIDAAGKIIGFPKINVTFDGLKQLIRVPR